MDSMIENAGPPSAQFALPGAANLLPPEAAEKFARFEREARDAGELWHVERERVFDDLMTRSQTSEARIAELVHGLGYALKETDDRVIAERARHADLIARRDASALAMQKYSERASEARAVVESVGGWLKEIGGRRHRVVMAPPVSDGLRPGLSHADAIAGIRAEIDKLKRQHAATLDAALPVADLKRRARERIAAFAEQGRVSINDRGSLGWPPLDSEIGLIENSIPIGHAISHQWALSSSVAAITSWLHGDTLLAKIDADIDARAGDGRLRMTDDERDKRAAKLAADLLARERVEEVIIVAAASIGQRIGRRREADPRAILGVDDGGPMPQAPVKAWPWRKL